MENCIFPGGAVLVSPSKVKPPVPEQKKRTSSQDGLEALKNDFRKVNIYIWGKNIYSESIILVTYNEWEIQILENSIIYRNDTANLISESKGIFFFGSGIVLLLIHFQILSVVTPGRERGKTILFIEHLLCGSFVPAVFKALI